MENETPDVQYTRYYILVYLNNYDEVRCRIINCASQRVAEDITKALGIKNVLVLSSLSNIIKKLKKDKKEK